MVVHSITSITHSSPLYLYMYTALHVFTAADGSSMFSERMHEISTFQMVQSALKSIHEKSQTQTLKSPHWLLSSAAARSYPVPRPGRYGIYGYPGSYPDTDTSREDVEVALPRRIVLWYECNFNYQVGAVE